MRIMRMMKSGRRERMRKDERIMRMMKRGEEEEDEEE